MVQCCSIKYTSLLSGRENSLPHWAFKLNSPPAAAETSNLKCCVLMVKGPHQVEARVLMMVETYIVSEMFYWTNPRQRWAMCKIIFLFKIVIVCEISR